MTRRMGHPPVCHATPLQPFSDAGGRGEVGGVVTGSGGQTGAFLDGQQLLVVVPVWSGSGCIFFHLLLLSCLAAQPDRNGTIIPATRTAWASMRCIAARGEDS